jgi:hypothetical protein
VCGAASPERLQGRLERNLDRHKEKNMLGENGTEQFTIMTRVDGKLIKEQPIHDPFLFNKTVVGISRWDLFKAMFRRQFEVKVEISVHGTEGIQRAIMMLEPEKLEAETKLILEERRLSRENSSGNEHCYTSGN